MDIKCAACGHTEISYYDSDKKEYVHEGEEFIRLGFDCDVYIEEDDFLAIIVACPICGTMKMIKDWKTNGRI